MKISVQKILAILNQEDPEGLLGDGTPLDEYEPEANRIAARLAKQTARDVDSVVAIVNDVWKEQFGPFAETEMTYRAASFRRVAEKILAEGRGVSAEGE